MRSLITSWHADAPQPVPQLRGFTQGGSWQGRCHKTTKLTKTTKQMCVGQQNEYTHLMSRPSDHVAVSHHSQLAGKAVTAEMVACPATRQVVSCPSGDTLPPARNVARTRSHPSSHVDDPPLSPLFPHPFPPRPVTLLVAWSLVQRLPLGVAWRVCVLGCPPSPFNPTAHHGRRRVSRSCRPQPPRP